MENSTRFKYDPFILNLSKKTVIQYNKGFKACKKSAFITKSNEDINHAYYTAFDYTRNYNNVIFLEEDAEVLYYDRSHYDIVDKYISGNFRIFTFGSNGIFTKIDDNFYSIDMMRAAHAQVISKTERLDIINNMKNNKFNGEVDVTYFNGRSVTYKYPLIVQLHPETENFNNWSGNKYINKLGIMLTGVDNDKSGWDIIYLSSKIRGNFNLILFVLIVIILFYFYVNN
tara:strand:- start:77 stop:760 length:684 start_codon:yes stop_codon:yes gene_type:complete